MADPVTLAGLEPAEDRAAERAGVLRVDALAEAQQRHGLARRRSDHVGLFGAAAGNDRGLGLGERAGGEEGGEPEQRDGDSQEKSRAGGGL